VKTQAESIALADKEPDETSAAAAAHWLKNPAEDELTKRELGLRAIKRLAQEPEWVEPDDEALKNAGVA
jgi:hypothetical protein